MTFTYITLSSLCKRPGELKAEAQLRVQWKWIGKERCKKKRKENGQGCFTPKTLLNSELTLIFKKNIRNPSCKNFFNSRFGNL